MRVEVRAAQPGEGAGLAEVWLENARYYVDLFPDDFRMPDELGLAESIEERLAASASASQLRLVAVVDGVVAAFVSARLIDPDEGAAREMLADRVHRRHHRQAPRLNGSKNAPGMNRTCDLSLRRAALYPLSYGRGTT